MARQDVFIGSTANDGTGDSLRSGAVKINQNFTELYDKFGTGGIVLSELIDFDSVSINFSDPTKTYATNLTVVAPTANRSVIIPNHSGNIVIDTATQILTNKTLDSCVSVNPRIADTSADHQYVITPAELTADRIIRLPLLTDSDTYVFANAVQTITNKILDSDSLINPRIEDYIRNYDGRPMLYLDNVIPGGATSVNALSIGNSSVGNPIDLIPVGTDTSIDLRLRGKGTSGATLLSKRFALDNNGPVTIGGGSFDSDQPLLIMDDTAPAGNIFKGLPDGSHDGEVRYIICRSASFTLRVTPDNFAQGNYFELAPQEVAHIIWDGTSWFVVNKSDVFIG